MDFPPLLAGTQADWLVIELDRCATDMLTAVEKSLRFLQGLVTTVEA
jgi:hypothetical protein